MASLSPLLGQTLIPALLTFKRPNQARPARFGAAVAVVAIMGLAIAILGPMPQGAVVVGLPSSAAETRIAHADSTAQVYLVNNAGGPSGDHHLGVDELLVCMGRSSFHFYKSAISDLESGPDGVVRANDLVLIKINSQWPQRGGTNTDVLKGIIARILEHPDGFSGEIVVVENTQGFGTLNWTEANAEDHGQSAQDVVDHFAGLGEPVSAFLWDTVRGIQVEEYSTGDMRDGYVVGSYQPDIQMRVSYPKFRTARQRYVSLKQGIWDSASGTYSDSALTFLNVPILKCHSIYGVTASLKHHVGTMTTALSTNEHAGVRYGGLGAFLGEVRMPDLNVLDCIYILAIPTAGPSCSYLQATQVNRLAAGVDPVALDMWATTNILVPTIISNGYTSYPMQDPLNPASIFRTYLDASMGELLERGRSVTSDLARIEAHVCDGSTMTSVPEESSVQWVIGVPNPTSADVTIYFDLPASGPVTLEIFDTSGSLLRRIRGMGDHIRWDGNDSSGRALAAGAYLYRASSGGSSATGKTIIVR